MTRYGLDLTPRVCRDIIEGTRIRVRAILNKTGADPMTTQSIMIKKRREQGLYVKVKVDGREMNYYPPTSARKADILRRAGNTDNCEVLVK